MSCGTQTKDNDEVTICTSVKPWILKLLYDDEILVLFETLTIRQQKLALKKTTSQ